ncbi:MAG: hypothetical protein VX976_00475 [Pseudomonadota bacterium]|nr:hypothetical protein [Pseudomonadota bacterium]
MIKKTIFFLVLSASQILYSDEIIQDRYGDFFLIKKDGTYKKLPRPKPGNKYVIEKRTIKKNVDKVKILKKIKKKARTRTNQGFR